MGSFAGRVTQGGYPPRVPTDPDLPVKRHPALHLMTSLRRPPNRGLLGREEDCTTSPGERIWTTSLVCLGDAETATVARSLVLPPGSPGGCRSFQ